MVTLRTMRSVRYLVNTPEVPRPFSSTKFTGTLVSRATSLLGIPGILGLRKQNIGDLFVIVFAMDSRETFEEALRLREQILETKINAGGSSSGGGLTRKKVVPKVPMVLAGNKCDRDMRTVVPEEARAYCANQECCSFVETSAKKNAHVDEVFYELFLIANLPLEMAPNHHKRVNASFGAPCPLPPPAPSHHAKKYTLSVKRRLSDACGVVTPNVRRPSIRTDLMIMRAKTCSLGDNNGNGNNSVLNWKPLNNGSCTLQ